MSNRCSEDFQNNPDRSPEILSYMQLLNEIFIHNYFISHNTIQIFHTYIIYLIICGFIQLRQEGCPLGFQLRFAQSHIIARIFRRSRLRGDLLSRWRWRWRWIRTRSPFVLVPFLLLFLLKYKNPIIATVYSRIRKKLAFLDPSTGLRGVPITSGLP